LSNDVHTDKLLGGHFIYYFCLYCFKAMIRELITPTKNIYILNLPDEMVGKTVEVIAFEVDNDKPISQMKSALIKKDIKEKYSRYPVISHDKYDFNRDEANDYE
jgi:hypothetical protein